MDRQSVKQLGDSASRRSLDEPANNLPGRANEFVGRSTELACVRQLLGEALLLTLVDAGSCGKTRLALQGAAGGERFAGGVWWMELAALEDADLLLCCDSVCRQAITPAPPAQVIA